MAVEFANPAISDKVKELTALRDAFLETDALTALKAGVVRIRTAFDSGDLGAIRQASIDVQGPLYRYMDSRLPPPDMPPYRRAARLLQQLELEFVRDLKQAKPLLLELETLVGVGPGLEGERYREGAMSVGAMTSTSKKGVLGKFGLNVPGIDSTIASMLTGSPPYVAPGAQKSEAATKAGLTGVKGARRKTRKGRKGKKMTRRRR